MCREVEEEAELESDHNGGGRADREEPQVFNGHVKGLRRRKEREKKKRAEAHGEWCSKHTRACVLGGLMLVITVVIVVW